MAAERYQQAYYPRPYRDNSFDSRSNAALPPIPPSRSYSSLKDSAYPYSHSTPSRSYSGVSGRSPVDYADPFEDENSIPLSGRKKHDSQTTVSPIMPHEMDDPFVRDADPRKKRQRRGNRRCTWFTGKITYVVFFLTVVQLIVFLAEIIRNGVLTGSPIEIHPSVNPMIGPSIYVMINMGARYQPCMHNMANVQNNTVEISWPCPNATALTGPSVSCSLSELCGFNGVPNPHPGGSIHEKPAPNQWWRFIVPIFIHAGIVHITFNLLLQLTMGRDIEKLIGSVRFTVVYFASGIFGFVLGGNFAATGIASCGCSGSLFGILALTVLDLLYTWKHRAAPIRDLLFICLDIIIAFVLGLLPGLDNFSHIGGFLMGLVLGVCILRSPSAISRRTDGVEPYTPQYKYSGVSAPPPKGQEPSIRAFTRDPIGFFQDRRGIWWTWWLVRALALVGILICFVLLIKNFYIWGTTCGWCKYLSCLPVTVNGENWCQVGNLNFTPIQSTTPNKRGLAHLAYDAGFSVVL